MDGELTPPDVMEKTMVMNDVNEDLLREGPSSSEHISPIKKDLHPTESEDTFTIGSQLHFDPKDDVNGALPVYVPRRKKNDPPQHPPALRPTCNKPSASEKSQLYSTTSRSRIKTTSCTNETLNGDPCAPILLACLFCNPLDCLSATLTGCHACTLSLCSYLCGCQPATLEPLLNMGDCCSGLAVHCCCCCSPDCTGCSVCLPAVECIDLAMEFSQMVFH